MTWSGIISWLGARRSAILTATSGAVVAGLIATVAIVSGGYDAQRLDLDDGSVWVANSSEQVVGRANTEILALDTVVDSTGTALSVLQDQSTVLVIDRTDNKVDIIDQATAVIEDSVPLPPEDPRVFLTDGSVVVLAAGTGELWIVPTDDFADFDAESEPTKTFGADAVASVSDTGTVFVYSPEAGEVYRIDTADPDTVTAAPARFGEDGDEVTITSVGDRWVLLDADSGQLSIEGRIVDLTAVVPDAAAPVLQLPSDSDDRILVAFSGGLVATTIAGVDPVLLAGLGRAVAGTAAAPLVLGRCTYAAWTDGTAWRDCEGTIDRLDLNSVPPGATGLAFVHRAERVALNDPTGGGTWAVQGEGDLIDNWGDLIDQNEDENTIQADDLDQEPQYEKEQALPVAVDDDFGARPSRSSVLPVLLNDYDPNGDVLSIDDVDALDESVGRLDVINDRQQLQLTLTPEAAGSFTFDYSVSDGRGGAASATVTVTVRQPGENGAPAQQRQSRLGVETTNSATASVLGDWVDPDGDAFYLVRASVSAPDQVSYKPEGSVVFQENNGSGDQRIVGLTVSDGSAEGAGSLIVTVKAQGDVPLVPDAFAITTYADRETTVSPLLHVRGGSGAYRLSSVPAKPGSTIEASLEAGTFRFTSDQVRTHLLEYVVTDGDQTATGTVRIDVLAPPDASTPPITTPKTVFLSPGTTETVDIASSDSDPAGGVLLVTGVDELAASSQVSAVVIEQRAIRVTLAGPLDAGPVTFGYRVTNGLATSEGSVTVVEVPPPGRFQPPVATDDAVTVRVGAAIDIPVLANDEQPDGEEIVLDPELVNPPGLQGGLAFVSGDVVRYLAPKRTGTFTIDYRISSRDQSDQGRVTVTVREAVLATNAAPVPLPVTGRVLSGQTVRLAIPLSGIDPDGDSVQLLGQETNPERGAVIKVGPDYIDYQAADYSAGTDLFTYTVVDGLGARATGTVRVGIAPRPEGGRNPVAVTDNVRIRPGKTVSVQVLANDSDPDGGGLTVTAVQAQTPDVQAVIVGSTVVDVTPPAAEGSYGLVYTIESDSGGTATAFITVDVDATAPPARPQASDTVLTLSDIIDRDSVDVDVLSNVFFADGDVRELSVDVLPGYSESAEVTARKRIRVRIENERQIIPFSVTNPDDAGAVGYAFLWVPGLEDTLPQLNTTRRAPTVASEAALTIDINDYVLAVGGRQVRLVDTTTVQATHSNGEPLVVDARTLRFVSADTYFGPASISFTVTDGTSADDPDGRVATIVLPIQVTPRENQPPVFQGQTLQFEPGEEREIDLRRLTTYNNPEDSDELEYLALAPLPGGFDYRITGSTLVISARETTVKGTTASLSISVKDAVSTGVSGTIRLDVVGSTRPLAQPVPDVVVAPRGKTTTVDVLANDQTTNPFPGQPLRVVGIRGLDGGSVPAGISVTPSADNSRLTVSVAPTAEPIDTNLQYQVADITGDPDRYVYGSVRISVQDRPDAPLPPTRADGGYEEGQLTVRISAPPSNNSPITRYELISTSHGDYRHDCGVELRCALSDLTPGLKYQFAVIATNALGASDPSSQSVELSADYLPAAPASVTATATAASTSGSLAVSWAAVANPNPGSAVSRYVVRVVGPGVDFRTTVPATATSLNTDANGTLVPNAQYIVTVYAQNAALVLSDADWRRTSSAPVTTVGPPGQVANLTATSVDSAGRIVVTWGAASPNGGASVTYRIARIAEGAAAPACTSSVGSAAASGYTDTGVSDSQRVQYVVYGDNGLFCTTTTSGVVESKAAPGKATAAVSVQQRGTTGQFDLFLGDLSVTSGIAAKYEVNVQGTGWTAVAANSWLTSAGNAGVYGNAQSVQVRGCRDQTESLCGPASDPVSLVPVTTRAAITACVQGERPTTADPINANTTEILYFFDYDTGLGYDGFVQEEPAPTPLVPGPVGVRVQTQVTVAGQEPRSDPGYFQTTCQAPAG